MTIEIIIGVVGAVLAIATYVQGKKTKEIKLPEPTEEMDNLRVHFKINQKLSMEIQDILKKNISENHAENNCLFGNMTFSEYLKFIESEHEKCLSEKVYNTLFEQKFTRSTIESMLDSLKKQNNNLLMVKNSLGYTYTHI